MSRTSGKVPSREFSPHRTAVGFPGVLASLCWVNSLPWSESYSQTTQTCTSRRSCFQTLVLWGPPCPHSLPPCSLAFPPGNRSGGTGPSDDLVLRLAPGCMRC